MYQQHNTCLALLVLPLSQGHATAALLVSSERYVVIIRSAIDITFPSVCLQHACTVHKQMSFYRICLWKLVGHGSGSVAKNSAETFAAGFPTWWFVVYNGDKNCDFRPMSRFISDTIQDRTIVTRLIGTHTHTHRCKLEWLWDSNISTTGSIARPLCHSWASCQIFNRHFTSVSGSLNCCKKIMNSSLATLVYATFAFETAQRVSWHNITG